MHYLRERQELLSREELKNFIDFHRTYGSKKLLKGAVHDWVRRFPEDREALWALAQAQTADGQLESAMAALRLLLTEEPDNSHYLMMAADVELALYQLQRSYLNHISNERILTLLARLLQVEADNPARVYRKISQVYVVDWDYVSSLRFLEQAAESASQGGNNGVASDVLWVEAAQTALKIEEFGKARSYLLKALAENPQNALASQLLQELPNRSMSLLELLAKD
jgi:predicted Zn-dependent protease